MFTRKILIIRRHDTDYPKGKTFVRSGLTRFFLPGARRAMGRPRSFSSPATNSDDQVTAPMFTRKILLVRDPLPPFRRRNSPPNSLSGERVSALVLRVAGMPAHPAP
jgi:hypothetical protein